MRRSNFALRLQPSLLEELRKAAESEGVALNQLINVAVAEKVSAPANGRILPPARQSSESKPHTPDSQPSRKGKSAARQR